MCARAAHRHSAGSAASMATQITSIFVATFAFLALISAMPDSAGTPPLPGPGLSYGGIPYGSVSGNVAEFFKQQVPSSGRAQKLAAYSEVDYSPIEQYL